MSKFLNLIFEQSKILIVLDLRDFHMSFLTANKRFTILGLTILPLDFTETIFLCMLGNFSCFCCCLLIFFKINFFSKKSFRVSKVLDPDQDRHYVGPDLGPKCLQKLSADNKSPLARKELSERINLKQISFSQSINKLVKTSVRATIPQIIYDSDVTYIPKSIYKYHFL